MNRVDSKRIIRFFNEINRSGLSYILLRNIANELPNNLTIGKDIDLLVKKSEAKLFSKFLSKHNYHLVAHPLQNDCFLYGVDQFEFRHNKTHNIILDLHYQLAVRSLDAGQWIPLDQTIQQSAWANRRFEKKEGDFSYWTLDYIDEIISLVARSIFDKREFPKDYIDRIEQLLCLTNFSEADLKDKLEKIFFKYTPYLIAHIKNGRFREILSDYFKFKEY